MTGRLNLNKFTNKISDFQEKQEGFFVSRQKIPVIDLLGRVDWRCHEHLVKNEMHIDVANLADKRAVCCQKLHGLWVIQNADDHWILFIHQTTLDELCSL